MPCYRLRHLKPLAFKISAGVSIFCNGLHAARTIQVSSISIQVCLWQETNRRPLFGETVGVKGHLPILMMWYVFNREEIEDAKCPQHLFH